MRILFFSDLHENFSSLSKLPDADLVLIGGDFTTLGTPEHFREAIKIVENRFPKFLAVAGNMDPPEADKILAEMGHFLPQETTAVKGVKCLGVSGSHKCPRPTPYEWYDAEMDKRLAAIPEGALDLLVTHAPPMGFGADVIPNGMHVGSHAIANFAKRLHPRFHLCGHIHEAAGLFDEEGTLLVNCGDFGEAGNHAVIELLDGQAPVVTLHRS